jgi:hypothetical protein
MLKVNAMSPRRRPTTRLLTPMGWLSLTAIAGFAIAIGVSLLTLAQSR